VIPVWSVDSSVAVIDEDGVLTVGNIMADDTLTISATFEGEVGLLSITILAVGDQIIFPLSGLEGRLVTAELWDDVAQEFIPLGEMYEPEEIVIENVNPGQWYWLGLSEFNNETGEWIMLYGHWFRM
ncbi:MAG TPA: hypothetical protein VIR63_01430, partial [Pontiella sp.]